MKLTTIKIQSKDLKRMNDLVLHKTEPRWSIIERAINALEKEMERDRG